MIEFIKTRLTDKTSVASYASTIVYLLTLGGVTGVDVDWITGTIWGIANIVLFVYHRQKKLV
jgi:hypothetical protein